MLYFNKTAFREFKEACDVRINYRADDPAIDIGLLNVFSGAIIVGHAQAMIGAGPFNHALMVWEPRG